MDASCIGMVIQALGEMGWGELPLNLIGNVSTDAVQQLALINRAGRQVRDDAPDGWEVLQSLCLFNSVQGQSEYDLPADYDRLTIDTVWDRNQLTPMQGPLSPALWQTIKSGLIGNGIYFSRYRVVRSQTTTLPKKVFILDPPSATTGDPLIYEYQSKSWTANAALTQSSQTFQADTDVSLLPPELVIAAFKFLWRREKQLEFSTYMEEYNQMLDTYIGRDRPQPGFSLEGPRYRQNFLGYVNIPDTGYGH